MDPSLYFLRSALWPAMVFVLLLMIVGSLGNILILFIYRHHFHRSVPWLFIYVLSVLDLLACVVAMPSELLILATFTSYPFEAWCKISRYITFIVHGSSCVILMGIALNRYEKVCRPNKQMLSLKRAKIFCVATIIFAVVFFFPSFLVYGMTPVRLQQSGDDVIFLPVNYNVTGADSNIMNSSRNDSTAVTIIHGNLCSIKRDSEKGLVLLFYVVQFLLYMSLVVLVVFFYTMVIRKMIVYSNKQQLLLHQLSGHALRVDRVRDCSTDNPLSPIKNEPTADFSQDFCRNEISVDLDKGETQVKSLVERKCKDNLSPLEIVTERDTLKRQISPPVFDENLKPHANHLSVSDNNVHLASSKNSSCDPMETNELLIRRLNSAEEVGLTALRISKLQVSPVDPYDAMFEPLFLHASKTHRKSDRRSWKKSKKKSKVVSRSKSNVDVSMRVDKPMNRDDHKAIVSCRSVEGLATMRCCPATTCIQDGTMTLTRRTPKGSKKCTIPITGLSMKSAVSYNALGTPGNEPEKHGDGGEDGNVKETVPAGDNKIDDGENIENIENPDEHELNQPSDTKPEVDTPPKPAETGVSFKVTGTHDETKTKTVKLRVPRDGSSSQQDRNSENILDPPPAPQKVDYRRRQSVRPIRAHRTSRMLFWISLAFILSFLPFFIIVIVRTVKGEDYMMGGSNVQLGLISVLIRFTFVSNTINPLIYGLVNTQFRNRCSALFKMSKKGHRVVRGG